MPVRSLYRMPAEWEPHEGTWIAWPHERSDWPGKFEVIPWVYCEMVKRLGRVERLHILVEDDAAEQRARRILEKAHVDLAPADFVAVATNRSWTRDFCPIFVRDGKGSEVITDWRFNAWAKYDNWQADDAVPGALAKRLGLKHVQPEVRGRRVVLEGGAIDVNGQGALLTTEECLLGAVQQRNPGLERSDMERVFARYLGVRHTIWLKNGIAGDDTHGHVDDLARFVSADTIVVAVEDDRMEVNYEPLRENLEILRAARDQDGQPLQVVPLPMPEPIYFHKQRLPASYSNFYIANDLVLAPTFNDPKDRVALNTLARLFPAREVVGIYCGDLVLGLGTLHCLTQQQVA